MKENRYFRYLLASPRDQDWGLYVTDAGRSQIAPHTPYPPTGHPPEYHFSVKQGRILHSFQIVYITQGHGFFDSEKSGHRDIEPGSVFLLFPNCWHRYWPNTATGWHEHWIGFNGDYATHLVNKGFFDPQNPIYHPGYDESLLNLFDRMIDIIKNEPFGFQQTIAAFILEILAKLHSLTYSNNEENTFIQQVIYKAKSLITERIGETIDLHQLAESLGVSYSWFRGAFKSYTGFPPHQYLLELRIEKAKFLLRDTHAPIKQISDQLGFESPYYFSRFFKKKTRSTPSQWRKALHPRPSK